MVSLIMDEIKTAVFCDFDGTITRRDVGYSIFHHFSNGRNDVLLPDWKSGKLSSRDCLLQEAAMAPVTEEELFPFLDQFEINPGFHEFVEQCREHGIDLFIVSDGLDLYINYLLQRFNLTTLTVIANHAYIENGHITIEFPHHNKFCSRCGSCKGERIQEYRDKYDTKTRIIFVGDGYSDACATTEADILFAKKDLEAYCRMHNITYRPYDDFFDIIRELEREAVFSKYAV